MIPSHDAPIRVVAVSVVVDVAATSRVQRAGTPTDRAAVRSTLVLEEADADVVFPVRLGPAAAAGISGDRVIHVTNDVGIAEQPDRTYRLSLPVPDVGELVEIVEGSPVDVVVLLPAWPGVELVEWSTEKPATIYGTDRVAPEAPWAADGAREAVAGRITVTWQFDTDPNLDVVWRYIDVDDAPYK